MLETVVKPRLIKISRESGIPLVGTVFIGCIDRGTNMIQVRSTTVCNLKCGFCSTAANSFGIHPHNYEVDVDYLFDWVKAMVEYKGKNTLINLDSVGEPTAYPKLIELVKRINTLDNVSFISMQANGTLLTKQKIDALEKAGLTQLNLSLDSLNREKWKYLRQGNQDVDDIIEIAEYISKSKIKLLIAPVYLPNVNDTDIEEIIMLAKKLNSLIGIQKYETYKYSRKLKEAKKQNWWKFYKQLEDWEKKFNVNLKIDNSYINPRKSIPLKFNIGEKIYAEIKMPGWIRNQAIAVANNRCITINNCNKDEGLEKIKIIENKNNIYLAELA